MSRPALRAAIGLAAALLSAGAASAATPFQDTIAQRVLACTGCHGREGRAAADGYYPRIAGKPAGYLYNQLLNFRDGRRPYALMSGLLAPLSDAYLGEIAEHFAALELPYPPPAPSALSEAERRLAARLVGEGDAARGLPACSACHGTALTGTAPSVPGLIGLPHDYLNAQLGAWRAGKRSAQAPDCMAQIAKALTPEEIARISSWLAAQPVPANAKPAAAFAAAPPIDCGGVAAPAAGKVQR
ncbi:MAG: c-type cytochrome [Caldimonas sp.]